MPVRPTLLHRMVLVSFLLFRKNLGNLRKFFGQIVRDRPPWQKIARTPMTRVFSTLQSSDPTVHELLNKVTKTAFFRFLSQKQIYLHYFVITF